MYLVLIGVIISGTQWALLFAYWRSDGDIYIGLYCVHLGVAVLIGNGLYCVPIGAAVMIDRGHYCVHIGVVIGINIGIQ